MSPYLPHNNPMRLNSCFLLICVLFLGYNILGCRADDPGTQASCRSDAYMLSVSGFGLTFDLDMCTCILTSSV